ncbi:MAG TPA: hypothetical protein VMU32_08245 [Solirubrobacteraceae bacterium]|nr:hypothetical protein [Solirubrobacteraceae bacterium]
MPHSIDAKSPPAPRATPTAPRALLPIAAPLLALAVASCGGPSSTGVAHLSSTQGASSASSANGGSSSTRQRTPEQAMLAFAQCMRSNGEPEFPDPSAGGGFVLRRGTNPSSPPFRAAQRKCRKLMPGGGPPSTTHPSPQTLARFLRIAQCMRGHGVYDFPDPRTSVPPNPFGSAGAGIISDIEGVILIFPQSIDQRSPTFTRASAACAFPLHNH